MKWYCYRGRRNEWYSVNTVDALTPEEAMSKFLEWAKFFPDTIEQQGLERIAYKKGQRYFLRVYPKETGRFRFNCSAGPGDYRGMGWIEDIDADTPDDAIRRLVKRHKFQATHIRRRNDRIIVFAKGNPFFLVVYTEGRPSAT